MLKMIKSVAKKYSGEERASDQAELDPNDHGPVARERKVFRMSDFQIRETLGTGTFARVRLARHIMSESFYAIKILKKVDILRLKQVERTRSEIHILLRIDHPFIVALHGYFHDESRIFMVLDYIPGGEMFTRLRGQEYGRFSSYDTKFYLSELLLAIEHLHGLDIVYRDIKPENLLIMHDGHICLTDFGFAKVLGRDRHTSHTNTVCGTPEYLAPEIIGGTGYGKSVDWWAFGILAFEMVAGYPPFYADTPFRIYQRILDGDYSKAWPDDEKHISYPCKMLIQGLLVQDRVKRLGGKQGAADIKGHKFFSKENWHTTYAKQSTAPFLPELQNGGDCSHFDNYPDSEEDYAVTLEGEDQQQFKIFDDL